MTEYKNTLSLPRTDFPMRAQLPRREPGILGFWKERDIEGRLRRERHRRPRFALTGLGRDGWLGVEHD